MESTTPSYAPGPDRTQELLRESVRNEKDQAKKWLLLKPTIQRLLARHGRNRKTHSEIVAILKEQYGFNALYVLQLHVLSDLMRHDRKLCADLCVLKWRR